jgi:hypothetical protein
MADKRLTSCVFPQTAQAVIDRRMQEFVIRSFPAHCRDRQSVRVMRAVRGDFTGSMRLAYFQFALETVMMSIARLVVTLRPVFRLVAPSTGAAPAETVQAHHEANVDDIDRLRAFEIERVRRNPTSLLSPRF